MTRWVSVLLTTLLLGASSRSRADVPRELRCEGEECPTSVGWLVRETAGDAISCTAFLVAEDVVATARHCVATTRRDGSSDAASRFVIVFAETGGFEAETFGATVLRASADVSVSFQSASDWALLRLDRTVTRTPIGVDRTGIADGTAVVVPSVRVLDERHATLVHDRCATTQHSLFAPHVDDDLAPVQVLAGCAIERGSSGAPVLDARGRARAIVHAIDRRAWPWREPVRFPTELAGARQSAPLPIAYATNAVCVALDESEPPPPSCDPVAWNDRTRHPGEAASRFANAILAELERAAVRTLEDAEDEIARRDPREAWRVDVARGPIDVNVVVDAVCARSAGAPRPSTTRLEVLIGPDGTPTITSTTLTLPAPRPCDDPATANAAPHSVTSSASGTITSALR